MKLLLATMFAAMISVNALPALGAVSIANGGFEDTPFTPDDYTIIAAGNEPTGFGWTVGENSIDGLNNYEGGLGYDSTLQYVDLNGTPGPGTISQTFQSVLGQSYDLAFAYSHNMDISSATGRWSILDGAVTLFSGNFTHTNSSVGQGSLNWLLSVSSFTGNGSLLTLLFEQIGPPDGNAGVFLDSISIAETPEPSTLVSFGVLALVGVGVTVYHRRKVSVVA